MLAVSPLLSSQLIATLSPVFAPRIRKLIKGFFDTARLHFFDLESGLSITEGKP